MIFIEAFSLYSTFTITSCFHGFALCTGYIIQKFGHYKDMTAMNSDELSTCHLRSSKIESLPIPILQTIFCHLECNPGAFSQSCKTLYAVAFDPVTVANFAIKSYGLSLVLFMTIIKYPKILTENVARIIVTQKGAVLPRYLAQRLIQGWGAERKVPLKTVLYLLNTASELYGNFDIGQDDWQQAHQFLNQIAWQKRNQQAPQNNPQQASEAQETEQSYIERFEAFVDETNFLPYPITHTTFRTHSLLYYHPPFDRMISSLHINTPDIFRKMCQRGFHIHHTDPAHFIHCFLSYALSTVSLSPSEAGQSLQRLLQLNIMSFTASILLNVLKKLTDEQTCQLTLHALKQLNLSFDMAPVARDCILQVFEDSQLHEETMKDYPYVALYRNWPCPDAIESALRLHFAIPTPVIPSITSLSAFMDMDIPHPDTGGLDLDNYDFTLQPRTCEWILDQFGPLHEASAIAFDNIVLALANPSSVPYYYEDPPPRITNLFHRFVRDGVCVRWRHFVWMAGSKKLKSARVFLEGVRTWGWENEHEVWIQGRGLSGERGPPRDNLNSSANTTGSKRKNSLSNTTPRKKQKLSKKSSQSTSSIAHEQAETDNESPFLKLVTTLLEIAETHYARATMRGGGTGFRVTRNRKPNIPKSGWLRTLEEVVREEREGRGGLENIGGICNICGGRHC